MFETDGFESSERVTCFLGEATGLRRIGTSGLEYPGQKNPSAIPARVAGITSTLERLFEHALASMIHVKLIAERMSRARLAAGRTVLS